MTHSTGSTAPNGLANRAATAFAAYVAGDEQRLGDLVDAVTPLLWQTARAQGASLATAEDAVQTAWYRLVDHAERIEDPQAVLGWLVTTVKRETWRLVRGDRREVAGDEVERVMEAQGDVDPGPELSALLDERQRLLWAHVAGLPARCRELLRVVAFADRPDYASISESLGMPVGSIGPTRGRCLQKLRIALTNDPRWELS